MNTVIWALMAIFLIIFISFSSLVIVTLFPGILTAIAILFLTVVLLLWVWCKEPEEK